MLTISGFSQNASNCSDCSRVITICELELIVILFFYICAIESKEYYQSFIVVINYVLSGIGQLL